MSKANVIELKNPEPFVDDPITECSEMEPGIGDVADKLYKKGVLYLNSYLLRACAKINSQR